MPAIIALIVYIAFFVLIVWYGYVDNIMNIIAYETLEMTGLVVIQIAGVVLPPLGVLMGWII